MSKITFLNYIRNVILILIPCLLLVSCGSDNPSGPDPDPPDDPDVTSEEIGPGGGEITSNDGNLRLTFPEGALSGTETITITPLEEQDLGDEFQPIIDFFGIENAWELSPDGLEFNEPVTATIASDQTLTRGEDSLGVFAEFLFTSDNGVVEALDSLRTEVDTEEGAVTVRGQLNHFSLVVNGSAVQTNNGVQFFVNDIPEMLEVEDEFVANAVIANADTGPQGDVVTVLEPATYVDKSGPPIAPTFEGAPMAEMAPVDGLPGNFDDNYSYTCTGVGLGVFESEMRVQVQFNLESGTVATETFTNFVTTVDCIEAMPELFALTVQKDGDGSGTVVSQPEGISCGTDCQEDQADFEAGSSVILGAEPADGSVFDGWSGDTGDANTQDSTLTVTMDSARTVMATFGQEEEAAVAINSFDVVESTELQMTVDWEIQMNSGGDPGDIDIELDFGDGTTSTPSLGERVSDDPPVYWGQASHTYEYAGEYPVNMSLKYKEDILGEEGIVYITPAPPEITNVSGEFTAPRTIDFEYKMNWFGPTTSLNASFDGNSDGQNVKDVQLEQGVDEITLLGNIQFEFAQGFSFPVTPTYEITNSESSQNSSHKSVEVTEVALSVEKEGDGTVEGIIAAQGFGLPIIDCGPDCTHEFIQTNGAFSLSLPADIHAEPADGYIFEGWEGDVEDSRECLVNEDNCISLQMSLERTVTARFEKESDDGAAELPTDKVFEAGVGGLAEALFAITNPPSSSGSGNVSFGMTGKLKVEETQFGDISGQLPVAFSGAEGFIVRDLLTGETLEDNTQTNFDPGPPVGSPAFGVIGLTETPRGPESPATFVLFGETGFGFFSANFSGGAQTGNQPTAFDAFPAGGNPESSYAVFVQSSVGYIALPEGGTRHFPISTFDERRADPTDFDGEIVSAWMPDDGTPDDTPPIVLDRDTDPDNSTESGLYFLPRGDADNAPVPQRLADVGLDARKVRCQDLNNGNFLCAVTVFGDDEVALFIWDGGTGLNSAGTISVGDGPVDMQLRALQNGNIGLVTTGFNDNTATIIELSSDGSVISSNTSSTPSGCESPAHAILVRDDVSLKLLGTCFDSSNYFIIESGIE
mgnify:CR=1 FL=1